MNIKLRKNLFKIYFEETEGTLSLDHVGHIFLKHLSEQIKSLVEKIRANDLISEETDVKFVDVCQFNDGYLASCCNENLLTVFTDENVAVKIIKMLNDKDFEPYGLTTNNADRIYITDALNDRVIMTYYAFEHIVSIDIQEPTDVCFDKFVYICTQEYTGKIMKCNADFSNMVVYGIVGKPWQIKVKDQKAIVL